MFWGLFLAHTSPSVVDIRHVTIVDCKKSREYKNRQILVIDDKIVFVGPDGTASPQPGAKVVDATGNLAGTRGEGTYSGYFLAEDKYHVDWKGLRMSAEPKSAKW